MHPVLKRKVRAGLDEIVNNPGVGNPLQAELMGLQSFQIGKFRIIYRIKSKVIEIVAIGPRRTIYEETLRLVQREERKEKERL